jgi:hypothetical protein
MLHIDKDDIRRVAGQLDALYTALKCFIYLSEIKNKQDADKHNIKCWDFIEFTLMFTLLINWNEIFGINSKTNHWKEITFEQSEYIDKLYAEGNYNYASWTAYRNEINDLCNNFISFPDPYHHKNHKYNLQGIKISLELTHEWLHSLVAENEIIFSSEEAEKWPINNKQHIEELKQEIQAALANA